ncbi:DUF2141 domain-containing protein [Novosphingobium sp. TH158]|uniref:DUF2141 domain-containing protein n=1 Tax=Novosphingobium sp. TH158 TaxID=2067455 RepID=UPI000C7C3B11|nr:DUF2141 domain-containing protein [Novosphingobium sp. TH158]PLK27083.1 hypothetical protein C0V78_09455 [Novosphingobium sp. TH158]
MAISTTIRAAIALSLASAAAQPAMAESAPAGCTGTPSPTWVTVVAEGMRNGSGNLAITLYADDSKKFLVRKGSLYVGRVKASAGTTRGCIFVPKPGVYAIALYHDENANGKIDRSGLGLPTEGFGFTNNPTTIMSLPAFSSVRLNIPKPGLVTRIRMKYP